MSRPGTTVLAARSARSRSSSTRPVTGRRRDLHRVRLLRLVIGALLTLGVLGMHSLPTPPSSVAAPVGPPSAVAPGHGSTDTLAQDPHGSSGHHEAAGHEAAGHKASGHEAAGHEAAGHDHAAGVLHEGRHGDGGDHCGGHPVLMLCMAILVGIVSALIAAALLRGRAHRPLFLVPRWTSWNRAAPASQLICPPLSPRALTCVCRC